MLQGDTDTVKYDDSLLPEEHKAMKRRSYFWTPKVLQQFLMFDKKTDSDKLSDTMKASIRELDLAYKRKLECQREIQRALQTGFGDSSEVRGLREKLAALE